MARLAFDTATAACSVALLRDDGELFESRPPAARLLARAAQTTELLPAIIELVERAGMKLSEVQELAVGIGPGAFTGLRIGLATARAIATANEIEITPVSSLEALTARQFTPVLDARRSEFYFRAGGRDLLAGAEAVLLAAAEAGLPTVGDGAIKLREQLEAAGVAVAHADDPDHVVSAAELLRIAEQAEPQPVNTILPNYIRAPDAKVSSRERWMVGGSA